MHASLAPSSNAHYERAWDKLVGFLPSLGTLPVLPVLVAMIMGFIAYLHNAEFAPNSIISTLSAISYFHKRNGFPDPAKNFIVAKLLTGALNLRTVSHIFICLNTLIGTSHRKCDYIGSFSLHYYDFVHV